MIRIPRPGPGNGCLNTKYSGIPNSKPTLRTSSLNKSRNGSIISLKSLVKNLFVFLKKKQRKLEQLIS